MLKDRNNLRLEYVFDNEGAAKPIADGLKIQAAENSSYIDIAKIYMDDQTGSCCTKLIDDRFQTYIVTFEQYADFVYLLDEAYERVSMSQAKGIA